MMASPGWWASESHERFSESRLLEGSSVCESGWALWRVESRLSSSSSDGDEDGITVVSKSGARGTVGVLREAVA